jgi:hypothetical protein
LDDGHFDYITKFLKETLVSLIRQAFILGTKNHQKATQFSENGTFGHKFPFEENRFTYKGQKTVFSGTVLQYLCLLATLSGVPGNNVGS